jgi:hypothetical protein
MTTLINRRKFVASLAAIPAAIGLPVSVSAALSKKASEPMLQITDTIRALEDYLDTYPNLFSYGVHNELRHHYLPISEKLSRMHADIILTHRPMDSYMLCTLSNWHLTNSEGPRDPMKAITVLVDTANTYSSFVHLKAACLITAANTYRELNVMDKAYDLYQSVVDTTKIIPAESLQHYRWLAQGQLTWLERALQ